MLMQSGAIAQGEKPNALLIGKLGLQARRRRARGLKVLKRDRHRANPLLTTPLPRFRGRAGARYCRGRASVSRVLAIQLPTRPPRM